MGLRWIAITCIILLLTTQFAEAAQTSADYIKKGQSFYDQGMDKEAKKAAIKAVAADAPLQTAEEWQLAKWLYWTFAIRNLNRKLDSKATTAKSFNENLSVLQEFIKSTPKDVRKSKLFSYSDTVKIRLTQFSKPQKAFRQLDNAITKAAKVVEQYYERAKISLPKSQRKKGVATLLYFNDAHQLLPVVDKLSTRGGVARVKTIVDRVKAESKDTLVIFGGDLAGGTLFGGVFKGEPQVDAFNRIPIDGASFGQHDFDFGLAHTLKLVSQSQFPWFSANLRTAKGKELSKVRPYLICQQGNLKLAFIGLTKAMETTTREGNVKELAINEAVTKTLQALREEKADLYIAVTQMGLEDNIDLLKSFPTICAALTEEQFEERTNVHYVGDRPIIAPCGNQGSIVRLDLHVDGSQQSYAVKVYPVDEKVEQNPLLLAYSEKYHNEMERMLSEVVAQLEVYLDGMQGRVGESLAGNLITDSFRDHFGADLALLQGGGIRADLTKGPFSKKSAWSLLPFGNQVWLLEMTGQTIVEALSKGVVGRQERKGNLLQISGGSYSISENNTVLDVFVKGKAISLTERYKVAIPSYLAKGGGDFMLFTKCKRLHQHGMKTDAEVLIDYCRRLNKLQPKIEKRIVQK